jgi:hypothetical protein
MFTRLPLKKLGIYLGLMILGIIIGLYFGSAGLEIATATVGEQPSEVLIAPASPNAQHVCIPQNVAVFANRIHVRCSTLSAEGIRYFALSTADSKHAARVLSLLLTAKASGQRVGVDYNPNDTSGVSIGCYSSDCRLIRWAYIVN